MLNKKILLAAVAASAVAWPSSSAWADDVTPVSDGSTATELPAGVKLTPSEEQTADAVLMPQPGQELDATVIPADCDQPDVCGYTVHAEGNQNPTIAAVASLASSAPKVVALHGAKVRHVKTHKRKLKARPQGKGAVSIAWWVQNDDHTCSIYSCAAWEIQLNSKAYCDKTYAWGSRSRYGYAGYATASGTKGVGYSVSTSFLGFYGDPSRSDLFAAHEANVSAVTHGVPLGSSHYVHRHFPGSCSNSWLVTG